MTDSPPLTAEEAVEKALLYVFQLSNKDYRKLQTAMSEVAFIRALEQDGFTVATRAKASPPLTAEEMAYIVGVVGTALRERRVGMDTEQHVMAELRAALATPAPAMTTAQYAALAKQPWAEHVERTATPTPAGHSHHWVDGELLLNGCALPHATRAKASGEGLRRWAQLAVDTKPGTNAHGRALDALRAALVTPAPAGPKPVSPERLVEIVTERHAARLEKAGWVQATPAPALDVDGLLAELSESPLPGARYAYEVVKRRLQPAPRTGEDKT